LFLNISDDLTFCVISVEVFSGIENVLTEVRDIQKTTARKCHLFCQGNAPFENLPHE